MNALNAKHADSVGAGGYLRRLGRGLKRPESVLCTRRGDIYCADWEGGVAHLLPEGRLHRYLTRGIDGLPLKPNGIALLADGSFLIAQLGADDGGVIQLERDGQARPWLREVDGVPLPPTNFVLPDRQGRVWITVSTKQHPRAAAYRADVADGFIVCVRADGRADVVAEGLGYTNEVALHPHEPWLYVNETFGRRLSRFRLRADGRLGPRETVASFGPGTFPDGLAFDEAGGAWVVSIVSNRLIRVAPDGSSCVYLEESDAEHLERVEAAYLGGRMGRPELDAVPSQHLRQISSIAFRGEGLRQAVLGCLLGDQLVQLDMPFAGVPPVHWEY